MLELDDEAAPDLYYMAHKSFYTQAVHANRIKQLLNNSSNLSASNRNEIFNLLSDLEGSITNTVMMLHNSMSTQYGDEELQELKDEAAEAVEEHCNESNFADGYNSDIEAGGSSSTSSSTATGEQHPPTKKRKTTNKRSTQLSSLKRPRNGSTIQVLDRATLLADSCSAIENLSERISAHRVVAIQLRLVEIVISQFVQAYKDSDLSRIPSLTKKLIIINKPTSERKKTLAAAREFFQMKRNAKDTDCYANLDSDSSMASMLSVMDDNNRDKKEVLNKKMPTSLLESLVDVKDAFHRLKTGDDGDGYVDLDESDSDDMATANSITKTDIDAMKQHLLYDRAMNNLVMNLLNECIMINFEKRVSMHLLLTFEESHNTTAEQIARDLENLSLVTELWQVFNPDDDFDAKEVYMFDYRRTVILPGLRSKDTKTLAIKVNRLMAILSTDTKRKGRGILLTKFGEASNMNLDGTASTAIVEFCNKKDKKHIERRGRMTLQHHNFSAAENIEECLPDSSFPNGVIHELLINGPSNVKRGCNFTDSKMDVFDVDGVHDEESDIVKRVKDKLNTPEIGLVTILAVNEQQAECLTDILMS